MKKVFVVLVALLVCVFILTACGTPETKAPASVTPTQPATPAQPAAPAKPAEQDKYGGILKRVARVGPAGPIGYVPEMEPVGSDMVAHLCLEQLLMQDLDGNYVPHLAESWEVAPDHSSITLKIRKGVKFHDGSDLNAEAVAWNLNEYKRVKKYKDWGDIEVLDAYTVRINVPYWTNMLMANIAGGPGRMTSMEAFKKNGIEWARENPVGTGPFKFVSYERDVKMVFAKFENYWQPGKPYLDGIEDIIIRDAVTQIMAFKANEFHAIRISGKQAADLRDAGYDVVYQPTSSVGQWALMPSSNDPNSPLADKKIRMAIEYAIDREGIAKATGFGGLEIPTYQIGPVGSAGYVQGLVERRYDPEKAKQLLAEAGFPNGFKMKLIPDPRTLMKDQVEAYQQSLARVGIQAEIDLPESGKYNEYINSQSGWPSGMLVQKCAGFPTYTRHLDFYYRGAQYLGMKLPDGNTERLNAALQTTYVDPAKCQAMTKALFDDATAIPLFLSQGPFFTQKGYHDHGYLTTGFMSDWTPWNAWLEKSAYIK
jgi:peptide/nickel transport system substrate-binding protein